MFRGRNRSASFAVVICFDSFSICNNNNNNRRNREATSVAFRVIHCMTCHALANLVSAVVFVFELCMSKSKHDPRRIRIQFNSIKSPNFIMRIRASGICYAVILLVLYSIDAGYSKCKSIYFIFPVFGVLAIKMQMCE